MEAMFLKEIEESAGEGPFAEMIAGLKAQRLPIPQILHLFAFKPNLTQHRNHRLQPVQLLLQSLGRCYGGPRHASSSL